MHGSVWLRGGGDSGPASCYVSVFYLSSDVTQRRNLSGSPLVWIQLILAFSFPPSIVFTLFKFHFFSCWLSACMCLIKVGIWWCVQFARGTRYLMYDDKLHFHLCARLGNYPSLDFTPRQLTETKPRMAARMHLISNSLFVSCVSLGYFSWCHHIFFSLLSVLISLPCTRFSTGLSYCAALLESQGKQKKTWSFIISLWTSRETFCQFKWDHSSVQELTQSPNKSKKNYQKSDGKLNSWKQHRRPRRSWLSLSWKITAPCNHCICVSVKLISAGWKCN